jgi:hypothetical protein
MSNQTLPQKTREVHNHHFDSSIWNDFEFRDDDIIIATYAKSGTTWLQQIVAQLLFDGAEGLETAEMSPWMDLRVPPKEVKLPFVMAQEHRRFLKTHLPTDRKTAHLDRTVLRGVARSGWPSMVAFLGKHPVVVGDQRSTECLFSAFREFETGHAG